MCWINRHSACNSHSRQVRRWPLLLFLLLSAGVSAALPPANPVPGGIARVTLGNPELVSLTARFGTHQVVVIREAGLWTALVGLPISIEPGYYILSLEAEEQESLEPVVFSVKPAKTLVLQMPQQPVSEQQPTSSKAETREAADIIRSAIGSWSDTQLPDFNFVAPAQGEQLYPYSLLVMRISGTIRKHDYITFLTPPASVIVAPQAGILQTVATLPEHGATIFIDHGYGLISMLSGLGSVGVKAGDTLLRGETIGDAAQNAGHPFGEVNWALYLNGQKIDPTPFVNKQSESFDNDY